MWQDKLDLASLLVRSKPLSDREELMSGEEVFSGLRSFTGFDILPLVEFELEAGISEEEAAALIAQVPPAPAPMHHALYTAGIRQLTVLFRPVQEGQRRAGGGGSGRDGGTERQFGGGNVLNFDNEDAIEDAIGSDDPLRNFQEQLLSVESDKVMTRCVMAVIRLYTLSPLSPTPHAAQPGCPRRHHPMHIAFCARHPPPCAALAMIIASRIRGLPRQLPRCSRQLLKLLGPDDVVVQKSAVPGHRSRYYRLMMSSVGVVVCKSCTKVPPLPIPSHR